MGGYVLINTNTGNRKTSDTISGKGNDNTIGFRGKSYTIVETRDMTANKVYGRIFGT